MIQKSILFFLLLCSQFLISQNCIYKEFGINDGLPSLQVYDLYQASNGIIWLATDRGITNYNGYEFKTFGVQDGTLDNVVLDFYPQKNGNVYCATWDRRIFYFNEESNEFIPYKYNNILEQRLKGRQLITSLYVDTEESLHLGCDSMYGKLVISKDGKILQEPLKSTEIIIDTAYLTWERKKGEIPFCYYTTDSLKTTNDFLKIKTTNNSTGNLSFLLQGGKYSVFVNDNSVHITNNKGEVFTTIKQSKNPISLVPVNDTHFFVGYLFGGGIIFDMQGNIIEKFLEKQSVTNFLIDNEGGYWFSTLYSGVFYSKEPKIKVYNNQIDFSINSLTKSTANELYIGYDNGDVERIAADKKSYVEHTSKMYQKAHVEFDSLHNTIYVHSGIEFYKKTKNELKKYINDPLYATVVLKMSEPLKEEVILVRDKELVVIKNETTKKLTTSFRIHDACIRNDEIFFGTPEGAYMSKNDEISSLALLDPIFKNRVDDIDFNEKRDEIYFATLGAGIIIYDKKTETIRNITIKDGLLSDIVNELHFENKNELWVCTNSGLNKIKFLADGSYEITGLKSSGGLLNDGISDVEIMNDTVWIASRKGLIYAPTSLFDHKNEKKLFHLQIKEFLVNDVVVNLGKLKNLSYQENRIAFFVEGISFKESSELLYKYKLEGLDDKWYFTKNRLIVYPTLPYGNYTLKVAATTSKENEDLQFLEIPISIKAPLWKQTWFVISAILSISLLIYLFFKYRILSYNRYIIRELLRLLIKKIKHKEKYFSFKDAGKEIRIKTDTILYVKSSGNYIEIVTESKNYTARTKIGEFIKLTPDPLEYLRIHRSHIIRIDKVAEKNSKEVIINGEKLPVSSSYAAELNNLIF